MQYLESKLSGVLKWIWLEFTDQVWKNRNEVMYSTYSNTRQHEMDQMNERPQYQTYDWICKEEASQKLGDSTEGIHGGEENSRNGAEHYSKISRPRRFNNECPLATHHNRSAKTKHTTTLNSLPGFLTLCLEGVSDLT